MTDDSTYTHTPVENKRLEQLLEAENFLSALESCGVDNWEGYSAACAVAEGADPDDVL